MPLNRAMLALLCVALFTPVAESQNIAFTQTSRNISYPAGFFIQGDINHDGYPDFLFGLSDSLNIYALNSNGPGTYVNWSIPTIYCPSFPLAFGDFQRNGKNDVLVSTGGAPSCAGASGNTFSDYVNDGTGIFKQYKSFPITSYEADAAVVADFNGDHKLDAVIIDGTLLELVYGDGYGGFSSPYKIASLLGSPASLTTGLDNLIVGDFDGNGCPDVAWTEYEAYGQRGYQSQLRIAYGDCHGNFSVVTQDNVIGEIDNLQTADLNRDGVSDIVSTLDAAGQGVTNPTLQIFYGQKNRSLTTKLIGDPSLSGPIQVGDFNGDGYPDVAYMSNLSAGVAVRIVEGDAGQTFAASGTYFISGGNYLPFQLSAGDFNRDGKDDLVMLAEVPPSSGLDFVTLTNTSAYPNGTCVPPVAPGIHVCSPGQSSGSTVDVLASATNDNPAVYMELWVDGVKRIGYGSTHELRATLSLAPGNHRFVFFSSDAAGGQINVVSNVTVQ